MHRKKKTKATPQVCPVFSSTVCQCAHKYSLLNANALDNSIREQRQRETMHVFHPV